MGLRRWHTCGGSEGGGGEGSGKSIAKGIIHN